MQEERKKLLGTLKHMHGSIWHMVFTYVTPYFLKKPCQLGVIMLAPKTQEVRISMFECNAHVARPAALHLPAAIPVQLQALCGRGQALIWG